FRRLSRLAAKYEFRNLGTDEKIIQRKIRRRTQNHRNTRRFGMWNHRRALSRNGYDFIRTEYFWRTFTRRTRRNQIGSEILGFLFRSFETNSPEKLNDFRKLLCE